MSRSFVPFVLKGLYWEARELQKQAGLLGDKMKWFRAVELQRQEKNDLADFETLRLWHCRGFLVAADTALPSVNDLG